MAGNMAVRLSTLAGSGPDHGMRENGQQRRLGSGILLRRDSVCQPCLLLTVSISPSPTRAPALLTCHSKENHDTTMSSRVEREVTGLKMKQWDSHITVYYGAALDALHVQGHLYTFDKGRVPVRPLLPHERRHIEPGQEKVGAEYWVYTGGRSVPPPLGSSRGQGPRFRPSWGAR